MFAQYFVNSVKIFIAKSLHEFQQFDLTLISAKLVGVCIKFSKFDKRLLLF